MNLSTPLAVVTPTLEAAVLQALAATTGISTSADVHRRAGNGSVDGVRRALARLVQQGIVLVEEHGRANLYLLNRDHVAAAPILALTRIRSQIVENIVTAISGWSEPPQHASLFGSFARGEANASSDIDILLVNDPDGHSPTNLGHRSEFWREQVDQLGADIHRWTGNDAHIIEIEVSRLFSMADANDPIVDSWRFDHVHLIGQELPNLLRRNSLADRLRRGRLSETPS